MFVNLLLKTLLTGNFDYDFFHILKHISAAIEDYNDLFSLKLSLNFLSSSY